MDASNEAPVEQHENEDWPKLDQAAYHGLAGRLVEVFKPHTESDPVALLVQFLAAFGNAAGGAMHLMIDGARHALILFVVLVGVTSKGRKGTAWKRIKSFLERADSSWSQNCVKGGVVSGEGLVYHLRDPHDDDPGVEDKRLFAVETEFASLLKATERTQNTASENLRKAWDGDRLATLSKNSPMVASDPHLSVVGHITDRELQGTLTSTAQANGLGNRFCFFSVRRSQELPFPTQPHDSDINPLVTELHAALDYARKAPQIGFDADAKRLWVKLYHDLSAEKPGMLGAITGRAEAQVMRLAEIYAALDATHIITPVHLQAAIALWNYSAASVKRIFGDSIGDSDADAILAALRKQPNGMSRTDLHRFFSNNISAGRIERALQTLHREGLAQFLTETTGGRPGERWSAAKKSA